MNASRWLNWQPKGCILSEFACSEPSKPSEPGLDGFVGVGSREESETSALEQVLKGGTVELYLVNGDHLFIVADEADAAKLGEPRGTIYTAAESRRVVQIADPSVVAEVHQLKRQFNAVLRECRKHSDGER